MSRKLSLMTLALCAALIATPAMAQQPSGKDTTATQMTKKGHKAKSHHKKGAAAKDTTMMKKDSTKK
jgi:hypothetical protein